MTIIQRFIASALAAGGLSVGTANAGWNNAFEACCWDRNRSSSYKADCAPQPERRVQYQQRTYYEPVTEYKAEKYAVPEQVQVKSYYWEPVTSYRYSSYYDPCSGECQKVATPVQEYKLREQCNSVTRYFERTRMVPITSYRPVTVTQPVVTYYMPPIVQRSSYLIPAPPAAGSPNVELYRSNPPVAYEERNSGGDTLLPKQNLPTNPENPPRAMPGGGVSRVNTASRIAFAKISGEIVGKDMVTPKSGSKLVFVNASDAEKREYATANEFGEFETNLSTGDWYVYLGNGTGKAAYHSKVSIDGKPRTLKVVGQ